MTFLPAGSKVVDMVTISPYEPLFKGAGTRVIVYGSHLLLRVTSSKFIYIPFHDFI